jgi:hypothetical protein
VLQEKVDEMKGAALASRAEATEGEGSTEQEGDPSGQSAGTAVSGIIPAVM